MDTNSMIAALQRRRSVQADADQARAQADLVAGAFQKPQFTVGGGASQGSIGGSSFQIPEIKQVNYGDILGAGVSSFLGARADKLDRQAKTEMDDINDEFMNSTLRDDPQAMKLYGLAQAGLPGADKALAQHLAPKKTSMAVIVQGITSGNLSPEMAAAMAAEQNLDPEMVRRAAEYAQKQVQAKADRKLSDQKELIDYRTGKQAYLKSVPSAGTGRRAAGREITLANGNVAEVDEPTTAYELSPGQKQNQAKNLNALDDVISKAEQQVAKFPEVWEAAGRPGGLGKGQQFSQFLSESSISPLNALGMATRSPEAALLHDYANSEVLARMAQLGGNDSNEELRRMQASVPNALQNPETMRVLLKRFDQWTRKNLEIAKQRRRAFQTGEYYSPNYKPNEYTSVQVPDTLKRPVKDTAKDSKPVQKERRSFDDIFNEVNQ